MMDSVPPDRSTDGQSVSTTVIETVAAREGVDPVALDPPLHDVVDLDALDALFAPPRTGTDRSDGRTQFTYCGYDVIVRSDGRVTVTDPADSHEGTQAVREE